MFLTISDGAGIYFNFKTYSLHKTCQNERFFPWEVPKSTLILFQCWKTTQADTDIAAHKKNLVSGGVDYMASDLEVGTLITMLLIYY